MFCFTEAAQSTETEVIPGSQSSDMNLTCVNSNQAESASRRIFYALYGFCNTNSFDFRAEFPIVVVEDIADSNLKTASR